MDPGKKQVVLHAFVQLDAGAFRNNLWCAKYIAKLFPSRNVCHHFC